MEKKPLKENLKGVVNLNNFDKKISSKVKNYLDENVEFSTEESEKIQLKIQGKLNKSNPKKAKELLKTFSPNLLEELEGLAKGLEMELDTIIKFYSGYDVTFPSMGCTTLINEGYYVRNYDFSPEIYDARLVFSNPIGGYASVGFSQQVIGRLDGMNEKGLVVGLHFVNDEHKGEGFLATTIVRMVLEQCSSVKEAVDFISTIPHGLCYNYSITDSNGEGVVVEASPDKQIVHGRNPLICTNHFEAGSLLQKTYHLFRLLKKKAFVHRNCYR